MDGGFASSVGNDSQAGFSSDYNTLHWSGTGQDGTHGNFTACTTARSLASSSRPLNAEPTGRRAFLTELDPLYADVICEGFEKFAGT